MSTFWPTSTDCARPVAEVSGSRDVYAVTRTQNIALAVGAIICALVAERYWGATKYRLNTIVYAVPHRYEFSPYYRTRFEIFSGLVAEPDEGIWLLLPASELARDVQGYSSMFHGYSSEVPADMVVNILGGQEARKFGERYATIWRKVGELEKAGAPRQSDPVTGLERIIWLPGEKGTPGQGHANFYLIPKNGEPGPSDSLPPSCIASPDINGLETYDCNYTIHRDSLTFDFMLRQENLKTADRIPAYVLTRLAAWRL